MTEWLNWTELNSKKCYVCVNSVLSYSLRLYGLWPTRLLCPWNFPGKNTGVGCHFLLQEIEPASPVFFFFLHCRQILYHWTIGKAHNSKKYHILKLPFWLYWSQHLYIMWLEIRRYFFFSKWIFLKIFLKRTYRLLNWKIRK